MYRLIKFVDKKLIYKRAFIKLAVKSMFIISPFLSQKFIDSIIGKDKSNMILFAILNVFAYIFSQIIFILMIYHWEFVKQIRIKIY
ncbi:conserved domain protein [Parvimonas sp. oral taxon 393 str. F0440]|nr:conserved domain protein [Parvimonas sp. oral taxon 393 str. F0440]